MADATEVYVWFAGKLVAATALTNLLGTISAGGSDVPAIVEDFPDVPSARPCVVTEWMEEDPDGEQSQDIDKNIVIRGDISCYAETTEDYHGKERNDAMAAQIDVAVLDLPLRESCTTNNWRIRMVRRGPWRSVPSPDGKLFQKVAEWWVKATRNS